MIFKLIRNLQKIQLTEKQIYKQNNIYYFRLNAKKIDITQKRHHNHLISVSLVRTNS